MFTMGQDGADYCRAIKVHGEADVQPQGGRGQILRLRYGNVRILKIVLMTPYPCYQETARNGVHMFDSSLKTVLLAAAIAMVSTSAFAKDDDDKKAKPVAVCALSDLTATTACSGYFAGNLNGGSPDMILAAQSALKTLGYAWDGDMAKVEKIEKFDGREIEFDLPLTGVNFVSIHYGAGKGPDKVPGGTTGFYKVDAADGLFTLKTRFGSLSNAILYLKPKASDADSDFAGSPDLGGTSGAVPEPAVWMQLILGFGLVGFYRRRQQQKHVTA